MSFLLVAILLNMFLHISISRFPEGTWFTRLLLERDFGILFLKFSWPITVYSAIHYSRLSRVYSLFHPWKTAVFITVIFKSFAHLSRRLLRLSLIYDSLDLLKLIFLLYFLIFFLYLSNTAWYYSITS